MDATRYVIVGGGVAGTTAAQAIHRNDPDGLIWILSDEAEPLYSRKLLPQFTRGEIARESLFLKSPEWYARHQIQLWSNCRATSLDRQHKRLLLADGQTLPYDKLLLAGGAKPRIPAIPGSQLPGVMSLRSLMDADLLLKLAKKAKHAVVVGGGFITLDMIQALNHAGVATTVINRSPYYWSRWLDDESGKLLESWLQQARAVHIRFGSAVEAIEGSDSVEAVLLSDGRRLPTDLVLLNTGITADVDWLSDSGLAVDVGVQVNSQLQTDDSAIWAAGDIACFDDVVAGVRHRLGNWQNSASHGEIAGHNMSATSKVFRQLSTYSTTLFDHDLSFVGDYHAHAQSQVVPRGSARSGSYGRFILRDRRLVGATLLDRFTERQPTERMIENGTPFTSEDILWLTDETRSLRDLAARLAHT